MHKNEKKTFKRIDGMGDVHGGNPGVRVKAKIRLIEIN